MERANDYYYRIKHFSAINNNSTSCGFFLRIRFFSVKIANFHFISLISSLSYLVLISQNEASQNILCPYEIHDNQTNKWRHTDISFELESGL